MGIGRRWMTACLTVGFAIAIAVSMDFGAVSVARTGRPAAKRENPAGKTLTRAQKLRRALEACKKEKSKSKRKACERKARGRYGPTSKKPQTNGPRATTPKTQEEERIGKTKEEPAKTKEEERIGFTKVTLECPALAVVEKPIPISGTGVPGAPVSITYTTPIGGGSEGLMIDRSGRYTWQMTAQQAGTYTFTASSDGVTSAQCTTQAM
jgi:hypothetical protein